ncbi:MAG TPA: serine/threonine protein kinase, partial [Anaerolineae bacterium]
SLLDSGNVTALAFNPSGTELVSGTGDGRLFLWDVASGEMARRLNEHTAFVHHVVFSPDGRLFLSVSDDARLIL